jgi:RNA polymerase sigma-70 factor (ECF subfamily)
LVRRALALIRFEFEPRTWQAFWSTTIQQQPPADVAAELGMKLPAVYQARHRVVVRLRQELGGLLDECNNPNGL